MNKANSLLACLAMVAGTLAAGSASAAVTGQWDFNDPSNGLKATAGADLQAAGIAAAQSEFGTTASFGIADIGGQVAAVMKFPAMPSSADGYKMFPGAAANGSTGDVNQYTLIMDILFPANSGGYRALFQTSASNGNDSDFFVNGSNGIGILGQYHGTLAPDAWHRVALVVDLEAADPNKYRKFIDGVYVGSTNLGSDGAPGGRFSVWPEGSGNPSWIFSDEDGETNLGYVNSVRFSDYAMADADVMALGPATAAGIPEPASLVLLAAGVFGVRRRR